jgi:hypothetical protein
MNRRLAIAGGIGGAAFSGASVWAFTEKHIETVYYYNIPVQRTVDGYPGRAAIFLAFAILGFVVMMVGFLSKAHDVIPRPIQQSPSYACPYCGQLFAQGTPVCPRCNREIKW